MRVLARSFAENGIVGDCKYAENHYTYKLQLDTQWEAQWIAIQVSVKFNWQHWIIRLSNRNTTSVLANANKERRLIVLHKPGQTVGTLLHELAHECGHEHDQEFKQMQTKLLVYWDTTLAKRIRLFQNKGKVL